MSSADQASATPPVLATRGLVAGYGDVPVVHGADIEVTSGRVTAVVGPNGAGKSTLLKAILGLARVMHGRVLLDGEDVTGRSLERLARQGVGYVPQVDDVFDTLRVSENLAMGGYLLDKRTREERMAEVLEVFPDLGAKLRRYVGTMSGGERKMTAVARALMLAPRILVLDEPTAGLSPALTTVVLEEQVRVLANRGKALLLVEQKAHAALELSDWAYVMVGGKVTMSAPAQDVLADPSMGEIFLGGGSPGAGGSAAVGGGAAAGGVAVGGGAAAGGAAAGSAPAAGGPPTANGAPAADGSEAVT
jgi:branched-chain amino acid transport system ATP-binding protein